MLEDGERLSEVLVAATRQADRDVVGIDAVHERQGMGGFERGDDAFRASEARKRVQCLVVGARQILRAPVVAEKRVLRSHTRVVEPSRDRVGIRNLAVAVGQDRRARAVQDPGTSASERRGPGRLHTDQPHIRVVDEACEHADRVRATAHACDHRLRKASLGLEQLLTCLAADHRLQLADDLRIRRGPDA